MSIMTLVLIMVSVSLSAIAQIALKTGMSGDRVTGTLANGTPLETAFTVAAQPFVWLGLTLYGLGAVIWLFVLAKVNVSLAYPFVGLGFLLTTALAVAFLGEAVTVARIVGTCLVAIGIFLVALE